ncbi:hemin uptake protein HemP [Tepidicella xavieri]|jgi:hemin uptake protein HemP|uniref:Hemin uptake protein HemP n=1 Tax=Tepidicella xavieri TaxID=360241 RepID=A0A4R6UNC0_9BURK|nr:hemin uptake protein HemP [Tepidicella xavieri]
MMEARLPLSPATRDAELGECPPRPSLCHHEAAAPVDSRALLNGRRELLIHHQGQLYRLQATRQGKLILTK